MISFEWCLMLRAKQVEIKERMHFPISYISISQLRKRHMAATFTFGHFLNIIA